MTHCIRLARRYFVLFVSHLAVFIPASLCAVPIHAQQPTNASLREALTLHASFDKGIDADTAQGDKVLWTAKQMDQRAAATIGLPAGKEIQWEKGAGKLGGALRFVDSKGPMVFYKAEGNIPMPSANWSATISFWLSVDPKGELKEGFCDPIQITSKQWDDAALFVEFEKRPSGIPFRLGVYADKSVWNPTGRKFEDIPPAERPLVAIENPPFAKGKWTHVAVTFTNFNTEQPNGVATLYLDGKKAGELAPRTQTFTWDPKQSAIMLGLGYIGLMDDLAIFNRALTPEEIATVHALPSGIASLR